MLTVIRTRWFAVCLFVLAYILTAAASATLSHPRGAGCGSAECVLLLKMVQSPR
jgi:hypothetical protein